MGAAAAGGRALLLTCVLCAFSYADPPALPAGQWALDWADEFDVTAIDTSKWTFQTGVLGWGNSELQYNSDTTNVTVAGGTAQIIAKHEYRENMHYTSARLASRGRREAVYGFVEASIKVPDGDGIMPLFWTLDASGDYLHWPADGSIVIHEKSGDTAKGEICSASSGGTVTCGSFPHVSTQNLSSAFHRYGMYWDSLEVKWYFDDSLYGRASVAGLAQFNRPHYLILNLAVGGPQRAAIDTSAFPKTMYVDYVRWWMPANTGVRYGRSAGGVTSGEMGAGKIAEVYDINGKLLWANRSGRAAYRRATAGLTIVKIVNGEAVTWERVVSTK